jgi:hypothetical protein
MTANIRQEDYLKHARGLTLLEEGFIKDFGDWLPNSIIDCHAHCNLPEHVLGITSRAYNHMMSTFPSFTLEESGDCNVLLHPTKNIRSLRFPVVFRDIDHRAANLYLLEKSPAEDRVALYGIPDDPDYTVHMLNHPRVSALKMYYSYLEPPATQIYQYFPKVVLSAAQSLRVPIVLHPPTKITDCFDQLERLICDFPDLKICIAHLGLLRDMASGAQEIFAMFADNPLVYFDTALVQSAEVISTALHVLGSGRIMYGSDAPLDLIRYVDYKHPQLGWRAVSEYVYHWSDPVEHETFGSLAIGAPHVHWTALKAIKNAICTIAVSQQELAKKNIFCENAKSFYGF